MTEVILSTIKRNEEKNLEVKQWRIAMRNTMRQPIIVEEFPESFDSKLSFYERIVYSLGILLLAAIVINAGWSYVLLETGNTTGGGLIGALARILPLECLTCLI